MPRCTLVLTGAPLAGRATDLAQALLAASFDVDYLMTEAALSWTSEADLASIGVQSRDRPQGSGLPRAPLPHVVVVCPATFNTINKLAAGIADTRVHSFIAECLGTGVSMVLVPMINDRLWNHPVLQGNIQMLVTAGCHVIDIRSLESPAAAVTSGTGDLVVQTFNVDRLAELVVASNL